jgi:hypothetical protein
MDEGRDECLLPAVLALVRGGVGDSVFLGGSSSLKVEESCMGELPGETGPSFTNTPLCVLLDCGAERESAGGDVGERGRCDCDHRSNKLDTVLGEPYCQSMSAM